MRTIAPLLTALLLPLLLPACATHPPVSKLESPQALPLALSDRFQFRKIKHFLNDPSLDRQTTSEPALYERAFYRWGAVDMLEAREKQGHYFDLFWRARERANVTVRLEYKQLQTGNAIAALEASYPNAKGSYRTHFQVVGDDYADYGRIIAWRALLIVNGNIVDFRQSFLW